MCPQPVIQSEAYLIGPGDALSIVVWRNDELSATTPVRPDGKISTPLVDDMQAAGKTPTQLANDMEKILGEYIRTPEVSIMVVDQGAANRIQVVGEVVAPQSVPYRENIRLLDVIVESGGLTEFAAGDRARVVRQTGAGQFECKVRIQKLLAGRIGENILVYPGDVIIVPETRF